MNKEPNFGWKQVTFLINGKFAMHYITFVVGS